MLQLLAGSRMIYVDQNNVSEKASFQAVQKLFAIMIARVKRLHLLHLKYMI